MELKDLEKGMELYRKVENAKNNIKYKEDLIKDLDNIGVSELVDNLIDNKLYFKLNGDNRGLVKNELNDLILNYLRNKIKEEIEALNKQIANLNNEIKDI